MRTIASRDLRNHTADVLRQVAEGATVTITVHGRAVAEITPARSARPASLNRAELIAILARQADAGLRVDLGLLAGDTTDDLGPVR